MSINTVITQKHQNMFGNFFKPLREDPFFTEPFRPFRSAFNDPFFSQGSQPRMITNDPHDLFHQFFDENTIMEEEKPFFEKHFPQKVKKDSDPFKVLDLDNDASIDQIKHSYREKALKYHPKNDNSLEAQEKFKEVGEAYNKIMEQKNQEQLQLASKRSLFGDFSKQMDQLFSTRKLQKEPEYHHFTSSSYVEQRNGKEKKVTIEKQVKKDGKLLKMVRNENYNPDGSCQVTEIYDDGKDIKKKQFLETKQLKN